jgi:hypothetical protein
MAAAVVVGVLAVLRLALLVALASLQVLLEQRWSMEKAGLET